MNNNENIMYELYKDYSIMKNEDFSDEGYKKFIEKERNNYKLLYEPLLGEDEFLDCLKYNVLSKIAKYIANQENTTADMSLWMNKFFRKYNIIDKVNENTILDVSMFNRIKLSYDQAFERKQLDNIDKFIDNLPKKQKEKYYDLIKPEQNKDSYEDLRKKKLILDNIDKLENVEEPVKILIKYTESNMEYPKVCTLKEMNESCKKEEDRISIEKFEGKRSSNSYDKTSFLIIIDDGSKPYIFLEDTIDLGDNMQTDFYSFILKFYGYEKLKGLEEINAQNVLSFGYLEECIIDKFHEMKDREKWNLKLNENVFNKILNKTKEDSELKYVIYETIGASIVEIKEELEKNEETEENEN